MIDDGFDGPGGGGKGGRRHGATGREAKREPL
jgi:hypothetical protein